jgi:uncharacterized protein YbdZ (MbtH family)
MPFQQAFDSQDHVVRTTITGSLSMDDIDAHLRMLRRTGAGLCPEVVDVREAAQAAVSDRQIMLVAHQARLLIGGRTFPRYAVVVSSDAQFSLARKFACYVAGWLRVGVFDDEDAALDWVLEPAVTPVAVAESRAAL